MMLARREKLTYQIGFSLFSGMVSFLPSAGALPVIDENFSHVGVDPNNPAQMNKDAAGTTMNINGTKQNNVIGWRDFSVGKGETVQFDGGSHTKNYLNMVTGNVSSAIYGTIQGGKDVYIINPHGVLFGNGASVNVGNLYASTQNVNPATVINAANAANTAGTDVAASAVLGTYTNPTKSGVSTLTADDGKSYTNTSVSHLADVVSLIDDSGSVVADKVVVVGGHVRFMNSGKVTATSGVEAYYDQQDTAIDGYVHVGNATGANAAWATNSGKSVDYYKLVGTAAELQAMNANKSGNYMLRKNVDMTGETWTPVGTGTGANAFTGKFDGMMHEVQNLTINNASAVNQGLFGTTSGARIDNVGVVNPNFRMSNGGAVVGNATNNTTLRGVYAEGGTIRGGDFTGGLAGILSNSKIDTAYVTSTIHGDTDIVGGLVGSIRRASIKNIYFAGTLAGQAQYAVYGDATPRTNSSLEYVYHKIYTQLGSPTLTPAPNTVLGGSQITDHISTYSGWDISNTGGTNSIWRIYEGRTAPLLTAFMKGTIEADVSTKEYERAKDAHGNYIGAHASTDPTFADYTHEAKGPTALKGKDIDQIYDANVIKYVKNDGSAITSASDVDFLHKLESSDYDNITVDNSGIRNAAAMKSYIYSNQKGYDIVGGNVTIKKRDISSSSNPIKVASKVYDGETTVSKEALQAALDHSTTSFSGILADDQAIGLKLAATDTLATYTNVGNNADGTTYTGTNARDAGYNKKINTTGAITVQGATSTEANNYNLNAADIVVTGDITQREIYVGLHKTAGIDKTYDATSDVRELTSKTAGGTNWTGGTEGVATDENIYVDDSDEAHKILAVDSDTSVDYANSTAKYYDGAAVTAHEVVNATDGSDDYTVKYDNITLKGSGKANYKLVDKNDHSKVIYAAAMQGAASSAADAVDRSGTLNGTGTIHRRELDKETFQVLTGSGTVSEATKVYDGTSVYDSGSGAFKMMTSVIVDDQGTDKDANLAANDKGILKSEIDKIAFTVTTGKGTFKQGDRATDAVDAAGSARAKYVAYNLTATNEDTTKNWLGNYKLVDKTTSPETVTNLAHNTTTDIIAKGTITKRALYVDLGKKTGIDKVYDAGTGVANTYTVWNDTNTTAAANGGAVYAGDSLNNAGNRLVSDGTSIKVIASYDNKDVIRGINGDNNYTNAAGYETVKDNTHSVNYTVAVDGAKSYNYVLVDQNSIPADLTDKLKSTDAVTPATTALAGKGKITPAELSVSFGHVTKEYDKTVDLKASDRNRQPILSGLVGGETITVATVGQTDGYSAAYSDANVADNKTVNYTNLNLGDTAKNYKIKAVTGETVAYSSDRTLGTFTPATYDVTGKGDIKKATITYISAVTGAASKIYDGGKQVEYNGSAALADVKNYITSVTVRNGDGVQFNAADDVELSKAEYSDKNAGTGKNIDYTFTVKNTTSFNNSATATYRANNGTIEKREVELDSIVNSDLTRAYMGSNEVGAWDTSGTTPTALTGNSLVTFKNAAHVTGGVADQGDDTGLIAGDAVTNATTAKYDTGNVKRDSSRNVRTGAHDVTYNLALSGADAGNYRIVNNYSTTSTPATDRTTAAGHGTITPITVNATVGNITKVYNAKVAAENISSAVSVGVLFGDAATITGEYQGSATERAKDVGTNKDVNYTVKLGTSTVGSDTYNINDNYDIQQNGTTVSYDSNGNALLKGKGDITKATLAVQTSEDVKKTYNGNDSVTPGQGTVSAVAAGGTNGLQTDDNGVVDTVTFTVANGDKKYKGFTKSDGTVRSASDANANASDPDSTAMLWRVAYENVQAAGADLKNYTLVGAATENNLTSSGTDTYKITGKGRIDRVALADSALTMTVGNATKVYDGTTAVKYNEVAADAHKYLTNVTVDLGGGHTETFDSSKFANVAAEYTTDKNVASNTTATNNIRYTITLGNNIGNDNYTIGTTGVVTRTGTGKITARDVKATLKNNTYTKVYDGTTDVKAGTAVVSGDNLIALEAQSGTRGWIDGTLTRTAAYDTKNVSRDAGGTVQSDKRITYTNTFDSADTAANYNITYVAADGTTPVAFTTSGLTSTYTTGTVNTITPKTVSVTAKSYADLTKTWDNTTVVRPSNGSDGLLALDGIETVDTGTAVLNHPSAIGADESASGKYKAAYDGTDAGDHNVTYSGVALTGADAGNYTLGSFAQAGAGGASGTLTADAAGLYSFSVKGHIKSLPLDTNRLKINLKDITKTYDGTNTLKDGALTGADAWKSYIQDIYLEVSPTGLPSSRVYLSTDDITLNSVSYTDVNAGTGKSIAYNFTLKNNSNYSVTSSSGTGTNSFSGTIAANHNGMAAGAASGITTKNIDITKRNVDVTIGDAVKTYDGTTAVTGNSGASPAITTAAGLVRFETQNNTTNTGWVRTDTTPGSISGAYVDKNAGTGKNATYTITYGANDLTNYNITYKDAANNVLTATTAGTTDSLTTMNNTINKREVGLNTKRGITKVYDRNTSVTDANAVLELEDAAGTTGVIAADKSNLTVNIGSKAYDSKDVKGIEGSTIHYTNVSLTGSETGNYRLINGTAAGNSNFRDHGSGTYSIDGTGTITPKDLTITTGTGATKVYDGTTAVDGTTAAANAVLGLSGVIAGDTVHIKNGYNRVYASKNVMGTEGSTINYSNIHLDTAGDAANYRLTATTATGTGTITKRKVDVTIGSVTKEYDGQITMNNPSSYVSFARRDDNAGTGWIETSDATVTGAYRSKDVSVDGSGNVQSDKAVDWTFAHTELANYDVTYKESSGTSVGTSNTTATTNNNTITQKVLDVTFGRADKTYDGTDDVLNNTFTPVNPAFTGMVSGENYVMNSSALSKISGKYGSSSYGEPSYDVARDGANNVVDKPVTYTGIKNALRELGDNGGFKNSNYTVADTKSNQAGRINPRNITIDDVQADYDAVSRVYQKGTGGYTTEINDADAANSLHLWTMVPPAGGGASVKTLVTKSGVKAWFGAGDQDTTNSTTDGDAGTGKTVTYTIGSINNFTIVDGSGNDALAGKTDAEKFTYLNKNGAGNYRWTNSVGQTYVAGSIAGDTPPTGTPTPALGTPNSIIPRVITVTATGKHRKVYDGTKDLTGYTLSDLVFAPTTTADRRGVVNGQGIFALDAEAGTAFTAGTAEYGGKDAGTQDVKYTLNLANGNGNYSVKYIDAAGNTVTDTTTTGTPLSVTILGRGLGTIDKRKVKVSLGTTTGLDKTYDGSDAVTAGNTIVVERNADATDDNAKDTGILSTESADLSDNAIALNLAGKGKYQAVGSEGADGVYRERDVNSGYYDETYKDITYDVSGLTLTEGSGAPPTTLASNYELVTDNTVDYDAVRTSGASAAADNAAKQLRATGTINPKRIKLQTKADPTKTYDGTTDVSSAYGTLANITAGARTDADILTDADDTAATAGISLVGTPQYNSKNVSEANQAAYVLNQTNGNYDIYDVTGANKLSKWTSATTATAELSTAATITPKALTWAPAANFGYANKTYDGTDEVKNAVDNILSLSGMTGTNSGSAVSGIVDDADRAKIRAGLKVIGKYQETAPGAGNAADAAVANATSATIGVDADGNSITSEDALINHNVTYQISVDPSKMDATTAANYDFTGIAAGRGKGSISRAELTVETDSLTIPMDTAVPGITGRVRGAVAGGEAVNQGDFAYGIDDASYQGTGPDSVTLKGSTRLRPAYRLAGKYGGKTEGNYGKNYRFRNQYGSLDVKMSAPGSEDIGAKNALTDARRFTPDDFVWYDASLTDKKGKTYYREPKALVERIEPSVKIDGALTAEEALLSTIPSGFGNYAGLVIPVSAGKQDASRTERRGGTPEDGVKLTLLLNTDAPDDEDALEEESEEAKILARRRAMIAIRTEGLGVAM
ncbi:hypothetical protein TAMA11512_03470 [Selenomonas sp. TAMA-11512]|uniref:YDG domain-containing protein n=1 Tax=Selenomonas sp. TAMA-11512 TaxID=3095337 RepID=UPI0030871401|nr:hypothetical protein TAMA11512_03470 [Selenomonas sp. TAMA-11512]